MAKTDIGAIPNSRVGKAVRFGAPRDVAKKGGGATIGQVMDEMWVPAGGKQPEAPSAESDHAWGQYCFCAQRILWENGERSIRLGYFRRRVGEPHWEFAGQTTITTDPFTMRQLLEQTLAKVDWFE